MTTRRLLGDMVTGFRRSWRPLLITDVVYKAVAFALLTPLVGFLFRLLVAASGRTVLTDVDILNFVMRPLGWLLFVAMASVSVGLVALQQSALMTIASRTETSVGVVGALRFASARAWPLLRLMARVSAIVLAMVLPCVVVVGVVHERLLTKHDINWYLAERPPDFWMAIAITAAIGIVLAVFLIRLALRWLFAVPVLLFEDVEVRQALKISGQRTAGHRRTLAGWLLGWLALSLAISTIGTAVIAWSGRVLLPEVGSSLPVLLIAAGGLFLIWGVVQTVVASAASTTAALVLVRLYRTIGGAPDPSRGKRFAAASGALPPRRVLIVGAVAVAAIGVALGISAWASVMEEDHTEITAHRGASSVAPENTLAAFRRAIEDGADWVELDVQESADGVVLVVHDSDLKKVGGSDAKIWEATAAELRAVDIGSWFGPEFAGERVPTLEEVLQICRGRVGVNIELKYYGHDDQLEQRVVDLVEAFDTASEIVVMSLERKAVAKMRTLRPEWTIGLLTAIAVGDLTRVDADFLAVRANLATASFVRSAHRTGKQVHAWTVNDPLEMSILMARGVDNLITDEPALAQLVLRQRATLTAVERLLLQVVVLMGATPTVEPEPDNRP